ncbi:ceramidase domain-containing protein [uncultured Roseobacter sp.]|uniref:ceramidase domain-containing protein n=1 Tax=uncultured Roseobacter sp. TaxID=114847 RepID=UPI00260412A5|nr:ceramidase domain-containing protein [uncultured Roseobacter sp.]
MELTRQIDAYCERLDPGYWAEPLNAVTNLAFVLAAVIMWRRTAGDGLARMMCAVVFCIGVGSYLFHTHAQVWSALADVVPIGIFILLYLYAINRHGWGLRGWRAVGLTALFIPYAGLTVPIFDQVPGLGSSAGYAPVPLLILIYAVLLRRRAPELARGMAIGAGILIVSLVCRTLDMPLCSAVPRGTHFLWHLLNGLMLGWMIAVYHAHRLGKAGHAR